MAQLAVGDGHSGVESEDHNIWDRMEREGVAKEIGKEFGFNPDKVDLTGGMSRIDGLKYFFGVEQPHLTGNEFLAADALSEPLEVIPSVDTEGNLQVSLKQITPDGVLAGSSKMTADGRLETTQVKGNGGMISYPAGPGPEVTGNISFTPNPEIGTHVITIPQEGAL